MNKFSLFFISLLFATSFSYAQEKNNKDNIAPIIYTPEEIQLRKKMIAGARYFLTSQKLDYKDKTFRRDCSGFVEAVMNYADKPLKMFKYGDYDSVAQNLYENFKQSYWDKASRAPIPGDFIYFDNTFDKNKNGKLDDDITHIGIVEKVDSNKTIYFIHLINGRIQRGYVNILHPDSEKLSDKTPLNSYLRRKNKKDPQDTPYLASHLYRGFSKSAPVMLKVY